MSRTIHGRSTKALRYLHDAPAALAVYWCYVARMNQEGVAWPSGRGLEHDTGWNEETCLKGRTLLVELQALVLVEDYIRPDWRDLPAKDMARRRNLDKSQYYRPTGYIVVAGKKIPMLYTGGDEINDIDEPVPDARSGRASARSIIDQADTRRNRAELNPISNLDSPSDLDSSSSSSIEDDVENFIRWGKDKNLKPSKAMPNVFLPNAIQMHYARLGATQFQAVIDRCKARNGRSWDYYLNALRDEQVTLKSEANEGNPESYTTGAYADFINH